MDTILFALWFFIPAGVANAAPILAAKLPYSRDLNAPLDFGKEINGKRIFGSHKTWRGVISGILAATLVVWAQKMILDNNNPGFISGHPSDYLSLNAFYLGFLFGFGALVGDAIKSFIKRQLDIDAGKPWFPFDQLDYIIGGCLLAAVAVRLNAPEYLVVILVWFLLHLIFSYAGYLLKLKSTPI